MGRGSASRSTNRGPCRSPSHSDMMRQPADAATSRCGTSLARPGGTGRIGHLRTPASLGRPVTRSMPACATPAPSPAHRGGRRLVGDLGAPLTTTGRWPSAADLAASIDGWAAVSSAVVCGPAATVARPCPPDATRIWSPSRAVAARGSRRSRRGDPPPPLRASFGSTPPPADRTPRRQRSRAGRSRIGRRQCSRSTARIAAVE